MPTEAAPGNPRNRPVTLLKVIGYLSAGAFLGGVVAFGFGLFWLIYINTDNREGAAAMGVMFVFTPAGAVVGAIAGVVVAVLRRR